MCFHFYKVMSWVLLCPECWGTGLMFIIIRYCRGDSVIAQLTNPLPVSTSIPYGLLIMFGWHTAHTDPCLQSSKSVECDPRPWLPHPHERPEQKSWLVDSVQLSFKQCGHLVSKPVDGSSFFVSPFLHKCAFLIKIILCKDIETSELFNRLIVSLAVALARHLARLRHLSCFFVQPCKLWLFRLRKQCLLSITRLWPPHNTTSPILQLWHRQAHLSGLCSTRHMPKVIPTTQLHLCKAFCDSEFPSTWNSKGSSNTMLATVLLPKPC